MQLKTVHEPEAELMSAEDVWEDAQTLEALLHHNKQQIEPVVKLTIPLSILLAALDDLSHDDLLRLRNRVEELVRAA